MALAFGNGHHSLTSISPHVHVFLLLAFASSVWRRCLATQSIQVPLSDPDNGNCDGVALLQKAVMASGGSRTHGLLNNSPTAIFRYAYVSLPSSSSNNHPNAIPGNASATLPLLQRVARISDGSTLGAFSLPLILVAGASLLIFLLIVLVAVSYWSIALRDQQSGQLPPSPASRTFLPQGRVSKNLQKAEAKPVPFPLCEALVVPGSKRFTCCVPSLVRREKQEVMFAITSGAVNGSPILHVHVAELQASDAKIILKHSEAGDHLASVSTKGLWQGELAPAFSIFRSSGIPYGKFQKQGDNYVVTRTALQLISFQGNFIGHHVKVFNASGILVASAMPHPHSHEAYHVSIEPNVDAAVILLGLLVIDKCESQIVRSPSMQTVPTQQPLG